MAIDLGRWKPELHPRDSKGRFRDKWGLSEKTRGVIDRVLAGFNSNPPLRSNAHAASYLRTQAPKRTDRQKEVLRKFLSREGNENIQSTLRAGDEPTPDIKELDGMMKPLEHDLILSRVVGPDAFGLRAEDMDGVEEWSGQAMMDPGFAPMNIGDAYQIAGPHIEMRTLVPKGTPAIIVGGDGNSADDARTVILPREMRTQNIKFQSDGRGGWYAMSVVTPQQGAGKPARAIAGRPLPVQEKSPAIDATPDELERRGISPEEAGVPAPQDQPGRFGPATPAAGAGQRVLPQAPTAESIPNPAATGPVAPPGGPPGDVVQPAKAIKKAGGRVPVGAGQVVDEETDLTPREKIPSRSSRVNPDAQTEAVDAERRTAASDRQRIAREDRRIAAERVAIEREKNRVAKQQEQVNAQQAQVAKQQAAQIDQQQKLIDRLLPGGDEPERGTGEGSEGGTSITGLSETQKTAVLRRVRPQGTTDEDRRQQGLAKAIRAERGLPADGSGDGVRPAAKAIKAPAAKKAAEADLTPEQRTELREIADTDELRSEYRRQRDAGRSHVRALLNTQEAKSRGTLDAAKAAPVKKASGARINHIGDQIRGGQFGDLRPGDVVEIPSRNGRPARQGTVDFVDDNNAVHLTDGSIITPEGGAVRVVSQGSLRPSKAAQARAKRVADRAAAGLGANEAIKAARSGRITPEQGAKNLDGKVADLRKVQILLGDQAPPELPQVIEGLEAEARRLRGEGAPDAGAAKKQASAVKRAAKKVAKERAEDGGESPLVAERAPVKKATRLKKAAPAAAEAAPAAAKKAPTKTIKKVAPEKPVITRATPVSKMADDAILDEAAAIEGAPETPRQRAITRAADRINARDARAAKKAAKATATAKAAKKAAPEKATAPLKKATKAAPEAPAAPAKKARVAKKAAVEAAPAAAKKTPAKAIKKTAPEKPTITRATPIAKMDDATVLAEAAKIEGAPETPRQRAVARRAAAINTRRERVQVREQAQAAKAAEVEAKKATAAARKEVAAIRKEVADVRKEAAAAKKAAAADVEAETRKAVAAAKKEVAALRKEVAAAAKKAATVKATPAKKAAPVKKVAKAAPAVKAVPVKKAAVKAAKAAPEAPVKKAVPAKKTAGSKLNIADIAPDTLELRDAGTGDLQDRLDAGSTPQALARLVRTRATTMEKAIKVDEDLGESKPRDLARRRRRVAALRDLADRLQAAGAAPAAAKKAPAKAPAKAIKKAAPEVPAVKKAAKVAKAAKAAAPEKPTITRRAKKAVATEVPEERSVRRAKAPVEDATPAPAKKAAAKKVAKAAPIKKAAPAKAPAKKVATKAAPVKKAAVKAAPVKAGGSPGTANPSASAIKRGDRIMVTQNADGEWVRTMNKTGAVPLTVDGIDREQTGNQAGYVFRGKTDAGETISTRPVFGQNVFKRAPEAAPTPAAKKAPAKAIKKVAPEKPTITRAAKKAAAPEATPAKVALKRKGPGTQPAPTDEQIRESMTPRMKQQFEGLDESGTAKYLQARRGGENHTTSMREAKKVTAPATAKKAPAKAIKKAAPEKPTITRRPAVASMADDDVLAEASKIEGAPSTPRERAISRKAGIINTRREREAKKAAAPAKTTAKAPAKKVAAKAVEAADERPVKVTRAKKAAPEAEVPAAPAKAAKKASKAFREPPAKTAEAPAAAAAGPAKKPSGMIRTPRPGRREGQEAPADEMTQAQRKSLLAKVRRAGTQGDAEAVLADEINATVMRTIASDNGIDVTGKTIPALRRELATKMRSVPDFKALRRGAKVEDADAPKAPRTVTPNTPSADSAIRTRLNRLTPADREAVLDSLSPEERQAVEAAVARADARLAARKLAKAAVPEAPAAAPAKAAKKVAKKATPEIAPAKAVKKAAKKTTPEAAPAKAVKKAAAPAKKAVVAKKAAPEAAPAKAAKKTAAVKKAAPVKKAAKATPEAPAAAPAKKAARPLIKRQGKAVTSAEARRESALDAVRSADMGDDNGTLGTYRTIERNLQSGDMTPSQARTAAKAEARDWQRNARAALTSEQLSDADRLKNSNRMRSVSDRYQKLADAIGASQTRDRIDAKRFGEAPAAAPAKKAIKSIKKAAPEAPAKAAPVKKAAAKKVAKAASSTSEVKAAPAKAPAKAAKKVAPERPVKVTRRAEKKAAVKAAEAPAEKAAVKKAEPAVKKAAAPAPAKAAKAAPIKKATAKKAPAKKAVDRNALDADQIAERDALTPAQREKYDASIARGIGHDTAMRGVPRGEEIEALRRPAVTRADEGPRAPGTGGIDELRRPSAQFQRPVKSRSGAGRNTEEEKDAILREVREARAADPNWPTTLEERDLAREADSIETARAGTTKAAKATPRSRVTGEEVKPVKVTPQVAKARAERARRYNDAVPDLPGEEGYTLRQAKQDLENGESATAVKQRLTAKAETYRDLARITRESGNDEVLPGESARLDRLADRYEAAADLAGKRIPAVKKAVKPGEKVAVKDLIDGDVAILNGKEGVFRQPSPRKTFIEFPDGTQTPVKKTALAGMVRAKELQLLGGPDRVGAPDGDVPAKKARPTIKRAAATAAADTPGNAGDRRRLEAAGDRDAVKARADELVRDGKTSPAAWRQALDEAGPAEGAVPAPAKKATRLAKKAAPAAEAPAAVPAKKATRLTKKAAAEPAVERPVKVTRAAKKAPAEKFLPPLKDGTRRKSATNLKPGDKVRNAGAKNDRPAKEVASVERDGTRLTVTFTDGSTDRPNPNTAYWMADDVPAERSVRRARSGIVQPGESDVVPAAKKTAAKKAIPEKLPTSAAALARLGREHGILGADDLSESGLRDALNFKRENPNSIPFPDELVPDEIRNASPAKLRAIGKAIGLDLEGDGPDQLRADLIEKMVKKAVQQNLDAAAKKTTRGIKKATPAAPAKAAKKAAPDKPTITRRADRKLTAGQQAAKDLVQQHSDGLRRESSTDDGWVSEADINASPATLRTLARRGDLEMQEVPGPRKNSIRREYRPAGLPTPSGDTVRSETPPAKKATRLAKKAAPPVPAEAAKKTTPAAKKAERPTITRAAKKTAPEPPSRAAAAERRYGRRLLPGQQRQLEGMTPENRDKYWNRRADGQDHPDAIDGIPHAARIGLSDGPLSTQQVTNDARVQRALDGKERFEGRLNDRQISQVNTLGREGMIDYWNHRETGDSHTAAYKKVAPASGPVTKKAVAKKVAPEASPAKKAQPTSRKATKAAVPEAPAAVDEQAQLRRDISELNRTKNSGVQRRRLQDRLQGLENAENAQAVAPSDLTAAQRKDWADSYRTSIGNGAGDESATREANVDVAKKQIAATAAKRAAKKTAPETPTSTAAAKKAAPEARVAKKAAAPEPEPDNVGKAIDDYNDQKIRKKELIARLKGQDTVESRDLAKALEDDNNGELIPTRELKPGDRVLDADGQEREVAVVEGRRLFDADNKLISGASRSSTGQPQYWRTHEAPAPPVKAASARVRTPNSGTVRRDLLKATTPEERRAVLDQYDGLSKTQWQALGRRVTGKVGLYKKDDDKDVVKADIERYMGTPEAKAPRKDLRTQLRDADVTLMPKNITGHESGSVIEANMDSAGDDPTKLRGRAASFRNSAEMRRTMADAEEQNLADVPDGDVKEAQRRNVNNLRAEAENYESAAKVFDNRANAIDKANGNAPAKKAAPAKAAKVTKAAPVKAAPAAKEATPPVKKATPEAPAKTTPAKKTAPVKKAAEAPAAPTKAAPRRTRFSESQVALLRRVEADGSLDDDAALTTQEKRDRNRLRTQGMLRMDSVKRGNKKVLRDSVTDEGRAELAKIDAPAPAKKAAAVKKAAPEVPAKKTATPAKKAAPAKAAKAAPSVNESEPLGNMYDGDNMRMHNDSPTMEIAKAYADAGRNGSANRMVDLRRRSTSRNPADGITPQQTVDELRTIRAAETDPKFQRKLDDAIEKIDAPKKPLPDLPDSTPPLARRLIEDLNDIPYARKGDDERASIGHTRGPSLVDQVAEVFRDAAAGKREGTGRSPSDRLRAILRNKTHESNEASFRIWDMVNALEPVDRPDGNGKDASPLTKELRDWEYGRLSDGPGTTPTMKDADAPAAKKTAAKAAPAKAAPAKAAPAAATTARDRLTQRQTEARISKARGSADLADNLLRNAEAFRRGDNPEGFLTVARQDINGATPGDLANKRDTHAAGWDALKKALGPEKNWDTPDKLETRLRSALEKMGVSVDHKHGDVVDFDPDTMDTFDGATFKAGDSVRVVKPGLSFRDKDGTLHVLRRPTVTRRRRGEDADTGPLAPDGPTERASIRTTDRTRVPDVPARIQSVPDTSNVTPNILTGRQGLDTSDMGPEGDTPAGGIPVKDFTLRSGYNIQHGTFYRKDRIPYLVEHADTPEGKAHADEVQKALALHRQSLPLSKRRLQRSYGWVRGRNPKDEERARRLGFDPEDWLSEAVSDSLGGVTVYNRDEFGFDGVDGQLDHEFAHSLDHIGKEMGGIGSSSKEWHDAGESDNAHRKTLTDVTFDQGPGEHSRVRLKEAKPLPGVLDYVNGVTDYGVSDDAEDYAESFRLYRAGPIGKGRRTPRGPIEPLWFRDIFPARAAILDQAVPDFAEKQLRQVDQARGTDLSVAQRRELIKRLIKERDNSERSIAFRRLAETAPERRKLRLSPEDQAFVDRHIAAEEAGQPPSRPVSGRVNSISSVADLFGDNVGPDGVDVENVSFDRHEYTIKQGRAWRDADGTTYVIEGTDPARMRREMETLRAEVRGLPTELRGHTRGFVVADGTNPPAMRRAAELGVDFSPFASAGHGDVFFWERSRKSPLGEDQQFRPTLRHEASHNADQALGNIAVSPEWLKAARQGTAGSQVRGFSQNKVKGQGQLRPPGSAKGSKFPAGVTPYATSSVREDWAESSEFYFGTEAAGGAVGTGRIGGADRRVPIWFRDLFPARAAVLDKYFPEFAAQQLAEIARLRG